MGTDLSHIKVGDKLATRFTHREYGHNPAPVAYTIWEAQNLGGSQGNALEALEFKARPAINLGAEP